MIRHLRDSLRLTAPRHQKPDPRGSGIEARDPHTNGAAPRIPTREPRELLSRLLVAGLACCTALVSFVSTAQPGHAATLAQGSSGPAPVFVAPFVASRGAMTKAGHGGVNLNDLLLDTTAGGGGFVLDWTTTIVGSGGGLATDWTNVGPGQTRFPVPAAGAQLTPSKSYTFTFEKTGDPTVRMSVPVVIRASTFSVSTQAEIYSVIGPESSTNTSLSGRRLEIVRGAKSLSTIEVKISRLNSQNANVGTVTIGNEDDAFPSVLGGIFGNNLNKVTFSKLKVRSNTKLVFLSHNTFWNPALDKHGFDLVLDGLDVEGNIVPTQTVSGIRIKGSAGSNPVVRNCTLRNVGNGIAVSSEVVGISLGSILMENCWVQGFSDNAFYPGSTSGLCRIVDCIAERPRRDRSYGTVEADNTHLDGMQRPDGSTFGRFEIVRFMYLLGSGDAGCQGVFSGRSIAGSSLFENIIVLNPSGSHSLTLPSPYASFPNDNAVVLNATLLNQRRVYQPLGPWLGSDRFNTTGSYDNQPTLGCSGLTATSSVRRVYAQGSLSTGTAVASNNKSRRLGQTTMLDPLYDPALCFMGWDALLTYDWEAPKTKAQRTQEILDLLRPLEPLVNSDGTCTGAVVKCGTQGAWNGQPSCGTHATPFCDGSRPSACSACGNRGAIGRGCANSGFAEGALLSSTGFAALGADTLTLTASSIPGQAMFFQATGKLAGATAFGDGMMCLTGGMIRVAIVDPLGSTASYPDGPALTPISVLGGPIAAGQTRFYQATYRDAAAFCTESKTNVTNGIELVWVP